MKIISNLTRYDVLWQPIMPETGEIRKIAVQLIKEYKLNDDIILLNIKTVGRRILNNRKVDDIIELISGRKHRNYWVFKRNNKIKIYFAWYKIKRFSLKEAEFVKQNWSLDFFDNQGKHFVKQINGVIYPEYLINKYLKENKISK